MILTSDHVWNPVLDTYSRKSEASTPVMVFDDAWIGARAIILPGVTIARGCTEVAGSVVTQSRPDFSVAGGVPARVRKMKPHRAEHGA
ncbi:LbetaH domain-containing protein [Kinneretia aquatilis]|uniref:hypothetical protein n=1 Tax=Kinneretia aquatilis TaxID=2070761 RepID=UPI001CC005CC|nr:hypothetical protein [Paucibacter aquatile]WIV96676.1 hypothetical protein K9V56_016795 [Paucibacter aquatile]